MHVVENTGLILGRHESGLPYICGHQSACRCEETLNINADHPMKGTVFDVTGNKAYGPDGSYKGRLLPGVSIYKRVSPY